MSRAISGVASNGDAGALRGKPAEAFGPDEAWSLVLAVRQSIDAGVMPRAGVGLGFAMVGGRCFLAEPPLADLVVDRTDWTLRCDDRQPTAAAKELLELHLDHSGRSREGGYVTALLGQSLDGFIATRSGHSRYINGDRSLAYLHRLRALSDAVVIGVSTAIADTPQLTTRHCPGPHAVRVVIDPRRRLPPDSGLLHDGAAPTLVLHGAETEPWEEPLSDQAVALHLPMTDGRIAPAAVIAALAARGLTRLLIEGGGVTVSRFLEAGLLHRLQLAVAPLILGAGRPALPITPVEHLGEAQRPACRRYIMGEDVLFDLCLEPARSSEQRLPAGLPAAVAAS